MMDTDESANGESVDVAETSMRPRLALYKNHAYSIDQERRWRLELENFRRKNKRADNFDLRRQLDDTKSVNPWSSKPRDRRPFKNCNDQSAQLMLAEWFLFMPPTFEEDYFFKLCPKGRHVLVIAEKGQTSVYSRTGLCLATLLTRLPGGGLGQSSSQMHRYQTVLDCIMIGVPTASMTHQTKERPDGEDTISPASSSSEPLLFKVLDLVKFRSTSYVHQKFRERCEWLEGFHREQVESFELGDVARFEIVPAFACDQQSMMQVFSLQPPFELDGVLFYHGDVAYKRGATPLVGWLKPYMLPEWFPQVTVHPDYLRDMSPDYENYLADIKRYEEETKKYKRAYRRGVASSTAAAAAAESECTSEPMTKDESAIQDSEMDHITSA
nr:unnamed protein product [Spirometra erinaceieuropaei]